MADARTLVPQATLATRGFELRTARTAATAADLVWRCRLTLSNPS